MSEKRIMVDVDHVTIRFNLAKQKLDNLKEYFVKFFKRELMFQEFLAVTDVSFQIQQGESWGLVGTNGSGKSTLLKAISGIIKPHRGTTSLNGRIAPLIELGAGFDLECTARENIFLNGCVLGHSKKFIEENFDEIVAFAELEDFLDSPVKNFSSGMRARLGFAIATMVKPDILIVDEVLAVGDYKFQQKCTARMKELLAGGTTLLFVSHSIQQVRNLCDHAIWLDKGLLRMQGDVNTVCDAYMAEQNLTKVAAYQPISKPQKIVNVVSGIRLYWDAVEGAQKYGLWRSETGKNGIYKWITNPSVPYFTDTKVESGKTYFYKVSVLNIDQNKHSAKSEALGIKHLSAPNLSTKFNKAVVVQVDWNKIHGATGYAIYRKSYSGNDDWACVATIDGNATFNWVDTSEKESDCSSYRYTVRARYKNTLSGCRI